MSTATEQFKNEVINPLQNGNGEKAQQLDSPTIVSALKFLQSIRENGNSSIREIQNLIQEHTEISSGTSYLVLRRLSKLKIIDTKSYSFTELGEEKQKEVELDKLIAEYST